MASSEPVAVQYQTLAGCFLKLGFKGVKPGSLAAISEDGKRVALAVWQHLFVRREGKGWSLLYSSPSPGGPEAAVILAYAAHACLGRIETIIMVPKRADLPPEAPGGLGELISPLTVERIFVKPLTLVITELGHNGSFLAEGGVNWDIPFDPKLIRGANADTVPKIYQGLGYPARIFTATGKTPGTSRGKPNRTSRDASVKTKRRGDHYGN